MTTTFGNLIGQSHDNTDAKISASWRLVWFALLAASSAGQARRGFIQSSTVGRSLDGKHLNQLLDR